MSYSILRLRSVIAKTGLSRSTIYAKIKSDSPQHDESFPRPISLGDRAIGFVEAEVDAWLEGKINESRQPAMAA